MQAIDAGGVQIWKFVFLFYIYNWLVVKCFFAAVKANMQIDTQFSEQTIVLKSPHIIILKNFLKK
jgi:hypothetical protein